MSAPTNLPVDGKHLGPTSMISGPECGALRLLAADGWHPEDLAFVFGFNSANSIRYHARGGCSCDTDVDPVPEYRVMETEE